MEFNKTRTAIATNGKKYTFKVDKDNYYTPENGNKSLVFDIGFDDIKFKKYAVCRTNISHDKGGRFENRFGCPQWVEYDNGLVGYQNFDFFDDKRQAEGLIKIYNEIEAKDFKYTIAYADIFLVENDKV